VSNSLVFFVFVLIDYYCYVFWAKLTERLALLVFYGGPRHNRVAPNGTIKPSGKALGTVTEKPSGKALGTVTGVSKINI